VSDGHLCQGPLAQIGFAVQCGSVAFNTCLVYQFVLKTAWAVWMTEGTCAC